MKRAYRYRLYPTPVQEAQLNRWLSTLRVLWNCSLADREHAYKQEKRNISGFDQTRQLTLSRQQYAELAEIPVEFARGTLRNLHLAYRAFFRRCKNGDKEKGFPLYRHADQPMSLMDVNAKGRAWVVDGKLSLPKMDASVRMVYHRPMPENFTVAMVVIKKTARGWYVSLAGDTGCPAPERLDPARCIGVDVGLKTYIALSNGVKIHKPNFLREAEARLVRQQRIVSRRKKGSANRGKAKERLAILHAQVASSRDNFIHEISRELVDNYDLIAFEDLQVRGLLMKDDGNGKHGRAMKRNIGDAAWGKLRWCLEYKCETAGKWAVAVPARGTTQACSGCGVVVPKTLRDRRHVCPDCGLDLDRDENAARNILMRALQQVGQCLAEPNASGELAIAGSVKEEPHAHA